MHQLELAPPSSSHRPGGTLGMEVGVFEMTFFEYKLMLYQNTSGGM